MSQERLTQERLGPPLSGKGGGQGAAGWQQGCLRWTSSSVSKGKGQEGPPIIQNGN